MRSPGAATRAIELILQSSLDLLSLGIVLLPLLVSFGFFLGVLHLLPLLDTLHLLLLLLLLPLCDISSVFCLLLDLLILFG